MNPSTALASVLVDELVRCGVRDLVLAPGSRSAPLAFAAHAADAAGRLRLHVRIDERSAGFLALGLAKVSGRPVAVATTSGTAVANLHPAVLEAHQAGVPVVVLSADRPPELRDTGANQTADQIKMFGDSVRLFHEVGAPEERPGQVAYWRALVCRALAAASGMLTGDPGPVHLNLAFREPLVPDGERRWVEPLAGRAADQPWTRVEPAHHPAPPTVLQPGPRTVVLAGDGAGPAARNLAEAAGWPLLAEPTSGARSGPNAVGTYRLLLEHLGGEIERVVVVGRPTLSRPVTRLLSRDDVEIVVQSRGGRWPDVGRRAAHVAGDLSVQRGAHADSAAPGRAWLGRWLAADRQARVAIGSVGTAGSLTGLAVAEALAAHLPPGGLLVAGSSNAIRALDLAAPWTREGEPPTVVANRGVAGIDGTVSTALGAALAHRAGGGPAPAYALMGDLTFIHDANGLLLGPAEPRPDLCIVVLNDDGGGIFTLLEQGAPQWVEVFERVFGTPHGADLGALCEATGTSYDRASTDEELRKALAPRPGVHVVEVPVERAALRDLHARLRAAVADALG